MSARPPILIVGAGIAGLVAALALLRRGIDVEIYEQAAELREIGAGLQIGPNGSRILDALGLTEKLEAVVCDAAGKEVRLWDSGQSWKLFDLGRDCLDRFGAPYWMVHRGDFQKVLLDAVRDLKADALHLDATARDVENREDGATLILGDGTRVEGDAVIGADGVHSRIRAAVGVPDSTEFTGIMAWRGLARCDRLPEDLRRPVGANWIGPGGHIVTYPLRGGQILNFVGVVEDRDWPVESWTERGTTEECLADFAQWHPLIQALIRALDIPYKWALLGREPLTRWAFGRVCLMGDSCHPTLPFLAQGANMAIEDGLILARCIEAGEDDLAACFRRFEALRVERTAAIVRGSRETARRFHNPILADPAAAAAYVTEEWRPDRVRTRYDWLYDYDARTVPLGPDIPAPANA